MAAAGYQPRRDLLGAPGTPPDGYSARLDGGFHLDMDNPPRPRQGGKTGKGSLPPPDPAEPGEWNRRSVRRLRRRGRLRPERLAGDLAHRQSRRRRLAANHVPLRDPCVSTRTVPPNGRLGGQRRLAAGSNRWIVMSLRWDRERRLAGPARSRLHMPRTGLPVLCTNVQPRVWTSAVSSPLASPVLTTLPGSSRAPRFRHRRSDSARHHAA
jgi:hypothetical protein